MGTGPVKVVLGTIARAPSATVDIVVRTGADSLGTITNTASVTSQETDPDTAAEFDDDHGDRGDCRRCGRRPRRIAVARPRRRRSDLCDDGGESRAQDRIERRRKPAHGGRDVVRLGRFHRGDGLPSWADRPSPNSGDLADGAQAMVTVVLRAMVAGSVTETATVTSGSLDTDLSNNTSSVTTEVDPGLRPGRADHRRHRRRGQRGALQLHGDRQQQRPERCQRSRPERHPAGRRDVLDRLVRFGGDPRGGERGGQRDVLHAAGRFFGPVRHRREPDRDTGLDAGRFGDRRGPAGRTEPRRREGNPEHPGAGRERPAVSASAITGPAHVGQPLTYTIDVTNQGPLDEPDAADLHPARWPGRGFDRLDPGCGPAGEPGYPPIHAFRSLKSSPAQSLSRRLHAKLFHRCVDAIARQMPSDCACLKFLP